MKTTPPSDSSASEPSTSEPLPQEMVNELMADDMLPEYRIDYSKTKPNRYAVRLSQTRTVVLDADVAAVFTSREAVNAALRTLIQTLPPPAQKETV